MWDGSSQERTLLSGAKCGKVSKSPRKRPTGALVRMLLLMLNIMESLKRDLQLAFRGLVKRPGLSLIAVLTLVLGVAANISIFSVVYGALFRPLGFENEARLVTVLSQNETEGEERIGSSLSDFRFVQQHQTSFERLGFYGWSSMTLERFEGSLNLSGVYIDPQLFEILGVEPVAGRALRPDRRKRDLS